MAARLIHVVGGGPAGSAAAIAALQEGAHVVIREKSKLPRHKVCGEFLSPGVVPLLGTLGLERDFFAGRPAAMRRMVLRIGRTAKKATLPETAWGLSRYSLDDLMLRHATVLGAELVRARADDRVRPVVMAAGRGAGEPGKGDRLFGFKAHFAGPSDDSVELYFFGGCYMGVSPVENGLTNVCGLGPERELSRFGFDIDEMVAAAPAMRERLGGLRRTIPWLNTGPLIFRNHFCDAMNESVYPAGDALSFVDPFTGSGMLSAVLSGRLAGRAAARAAPVTEYVAQCRRELHRPFEMAELMREFIGRGWAERILPLVPGWLLFRLTRP